MGEARKPGATVCTRFRRADGEVGSVCVPAEVIAQAWRDPRQVRMARLLRSRDVEVAVMDAALARAVGRVCGRTGHPDDVVDVFVALCARERHHAVATSDPEDLRRVDPTLRLLRV